MLIYFSLSFRLVFIKGESAFKYMHAIQPLSAEPKNLTLEPPTRDQGLFAVTVADMLSILVLSGSFGLMLM